MAGREIVAPGPSPALAGLRSTSHEALRSALRRVAGIPYAGKSTMLDLEALVRRRGPPLAPWGRGLSVGHGSPSQRDVAACKHWSNIPNSWPYSVGTCLACLSRKKIGMLAA